MNNIKTFKVQWMYEFLIYTGSLRLRTYMLAEYYQMHFSITILLVVRIHFVSSHSKDSEFQSNLNSPMYLIRSLAPDFIKFGTLLLTGFVCLQKVSNLWLSCLAVLDKRSVKEQHDSPPGSRLSHRPWELLEREFVQCWHVVLRNASLISPQ